MIQGAFWKALPVLVITFVLMVLVAYTLIRSSAKSRTLKRRLPRPSLERPPCRNPCA